MRSRPYAGVAAVILFLFIAGCSAFIDHENHYIEVQKRVGEDYPSAAFSELTDKERIQQVKELLDDSEWETKQVDMERPADYRFSFQSKDPQSHTKVLLYELWISPNQEQVELAIQVGSKYRQLNKKKSAELFKLLTGETLLTPTSK